MEKIDYLEQEVNRLYSIVKYQRMAILFVSIAVGFIFGGVIKSMLL
jgi:hypothetical protein